jgi:hypothetical protein
MHAVRRLRFYSGTMRNPTLSNRIKALGTTATFNVCFKYENTNYLETIRFDGNILHLYPNPNDLSSLSIERYAVKTNKNPIKKLKKYDLNKASRDRCTQKLSLIKNPSKLAYKIKEISTQPTTHFENDECLINVNLNGRYLSTVRVASSTQSNDSLGFNCQIVHEINFKDDYIKSMATSPHIDGDCALLLSKENSIALRGLDKSNIKTVLSDLQANFESKSTWANIKFGSHPRSLIYADYSHLVQIDTRLKNKPSCMELYDIRKSKTSELIEYNLTLKPYHATHLLYCTNHMHLIDERYPHVPLLSWKHDLNKGSLLAIKQLYVNDFNTNLIFSCDLKNVHVHNFSPSFNNTPVLFNTTLKIDSFNDIESYLNVDYDKTLKYHLDYRLNKPIIGLSVISDSDYFAVFQVSPGLNVRILEGCL